MSWLQKIVLAQADIYLSNLGVSPEVIQSVLSQENPQWYINQLRQNPAMSLYDIEQLSSPQKISPYTDGEQHAVQNYDEPFRSWALVQFRKMRTGDPPRQEKHLGNRPYINYRYIQSVGLIGDNLDLIYDWWRFTEPTPEMASYTFEIAMQAQEEWHRVSAGKGEGLIYESTNPELVIFNQWSNPEWKGWTVQKVISENDLSVEGNLMNNCVGDYCKPVQQGRTEIFSLRDPKNKPHATLEIEPKYNEVVQIQGNSNREPDDKYKEMIKDWFQVLKNERPGLTLANEDAYEFDFRYTDNDIDEQIYKEVEEGNEYGLQAPLDRLDIQNAYDGAIREMTGSLGGWRGTDTRNASYIGKAIAWAAWQADKYRASKIKNEQDRSQFKLDSKRQGVDWLYDKIDENNDEFMKNWYYEPQISQDDFETEEEREEAFLREESEAESYARSNSIPYALDDVIVKELADWARKDPFLEEHKAFQKTEQVVASSWLQKIVSS